MASELKIKSGTKLRIAYDVPVGTEPQFDLVSTFNKSLDESAFLISVPMKGGKPLEIDDTQKLLIRYGTGDDQIIIAGYADDLVKAGIRKYWKIRRVQEQRQFFKRADARTRVSLRLQYMQDSWRPNEDGTISKEEGMTLDISGGGIAMYCNRRFDVGETVFVTLQNIGANGEMHPDEQVGNVCWMREAPKGSPFRYVCGMQFRYDSDDAKKKLLEYIAAVKKRFKV